MTETLSKKKKVVFTIVVIFLLLGTMELALNFVNFGKLLLREKQATFEAYQDPLAEEFFRDNKECSRQFTEYKTQKSTFVRYLLHDQYAPCKTPTINYLPESITFVRKTWNPDVSALASGVPTSSIVVFGGSTVEGAGSVDEFTIPSHFSKIINANAGVTRSYFVVNYGVGSYTFTQAVMKLLLLLREGKRFNYVIMYNGSNDVENSYEAGEAGALLAEKIIRDKLESQNTPITQRIITTLGENCNLCKVAYIVSRHTPILKTYITPQLNRARGYVNPRKGEKMTPSEIEQLAHDIAEYYKKSHDLLDALSRVYGFRYVEFWQPTLFYDDKLIGGESMLKNTGARLEDEKLRSLYASTLRILREWQLENFYDISETLNGRTKAYYLDQVHVNGEANGVIAKTMYDIFLEWAVQSRQ